MPLQHKDLPPEHSHTPYRWIVANANERNALIVTADQIGKRLWQQDNDTEWTLKSVAPAEWVIAAPVQSVHGRAGAVTAQSGDYTAGQVGADPAGTASAAVTGHEQAADPHNQYVQKVTGKTLSTEDYTTAEQAKLTGIATGATKNATDAQLRDRATHTGTQAASTVTGLAAVATTGSYGDLLNKPDLSALEEVTVYASKAAFPATGEASKVYIAEDTGYMHRWSGTAYVQMTDQTAIWGQVSGALADQADLAAALAGKVDKVTGKVLSTNDYTTAEQSKLTGIEPGATADQTKADIDALNIDADTVDGKHASDFDPSGSASGAVTTHTQAVDPHTQYLQKASNLADINSAAAAFNNIKQAASETATGVIEKATTAEAEAGTAGKYPDAAGVLFATNANAPKAPGILDGLRRSVEAASGGKISVFYTAKGQPSYFVRQSQFLCEDVAPGGELGTGVHEAFKFGAETEAEIWVGAYAGAVINGEGVSQPGLPPGQTINYDNARAVCQASGPGFDMATIWDWAAITHWCMAHGFEPRGNTNYGRHHDNRWEVGTRQDGNTYAPGNSAGIGNTLGGSGPAEWRHDGTMSGIADMVGNVWEWLSGMKIVDGRVFLSPDNAIPAETGYSDTLFDMPTNRTWSTASNVGASDALKRALIIPKGVNDPIGYLYTTLTGERLPFRGGFRSDAGGAGLGALYLSNDRTGADSYVGFRPRFRNL